MSTGSYGYCPTRRSKLNGIGYKVIQYLLDTLRISKERRDINRSILAKDYFGFMCLGLQTDDNLVNQDAQLGLFLLNVKLSQVRARHKENILNDRNQLLHTFLSVTQVHLLLIGQFPHVALEQQI